MGRGRPFVVAWDEADTEKALRQVYRVERDVDVRQHLHALWLLRSGERRMDEVAGLVGTTDRTVQRWVAWYRTGRLAAVRTHRMGGYGQTPRLTEEQLEHLAQEVATGRFRNALAIRAWATETFGGHVHRGGHVQPAGTAPVQSAAPNTVVATSIGF